MFAQGCSIVAPVPRPWAWAALLDARSLAAWNAVDGCDVRDLTTLSVGDEVSCMVRMLGRPIGATLCITELEHERLFGLRTESLAASIFETLTLSPDSATGTRIDYAVDVLTPVPGPAVERAVSEHAQATCRGLGDFLQPGRVGDPGSLSWR